MRALATATIGYLSSFPNAAYRIESAMIKCDAERQIRVSLRGTLYATHSGYGPFGPLSGAPLHIKGISLFD